MLHANTPHGRRGTDFLSASLKRFSAPQALMRAAEARHLSRLEFSPPILDIGCGNGLFGDMLFGPASVAVGLDISRPALALAQSSTAYQEVVLAGSANMPFHDGCFSSVLANSVLEHIVPLDETLQEVSRVLKKGGRFAFTVTHERTHRYHLYPSVLNRAGLHRLSQKYVKKWRTFFKEYHFYSPGEWCSKLEAVGLRLELCQYIHPRPLFYAYDLLLPLGLVSLFKRKLFGDNAAKPIALLNPLWRRLLRRYYLMDDELGGFLLLAGEKPVSAQRGA
ncbi:MAG: class I SAM-dependent methyltransferase [Chloroflexota bacterium]